MLLGASYCADFALLCAPLVSARHISQNRQGSDKEPRRGGREGCDSTYEAGYELCGLKIFFF